MRQQSSTHTLPCCVVHHHQRRLKLATKAVAAHVTDDDMVNEDIDCVADLLALIDECTMHGMRCHAMHTTQHDCNSTPRI